jgi:hypothetical protein
MLLALLASMACGEKRAPTSPGGGSSVALTVEPDSASLITGRALSLSAQLLDGAGNPVGAPDVQWVSADSAIATVSSGGTVTAHAVGKTTITASSEEGAASSVIEVLPFPSEPGAQVAHGGHYVSPSGAAGASGGASAPWDLETALSGANGKVQPGDTIWLRAGTYRGNFESKLAGSASAPIVVRQYPGERATIDGSLSVEGRNTWYWGFEIANSDPGTRNVEGVDSHCPGCRFINLVIHDHSGNGLGMWSEGPDQEAYGNIIYNNGFWGPTNGSYGHGIYAQNVSGAKRILDNILVNQFGYGVHIYTEESGLWNFIVAGNVVVNSGLGDGMDFQVGGLQPVNNLVFTDNMSYRSPDRRTDTARLGYNWGPSNFGAVVTDNYLVGNLLLFFWKAMKLQRNTIVDGAPPSATRVVVEPNFYEDGRANVVIYNWGKESSVPVDLSAVLRPGDHFVVRDAQNFYGPPVLSGSYAGGNVAIPITSDHPAPSITTEPVSNTGAEFNVYVVIRAAK